MLAEITMSQEHFDTPIKTNDLNMHLRDIFKILDRSQDLGQRPRRLNIKKAFENPQSSELTARDLTVHLFKDVIISSELKLEGMSKGDFDSNYLKKLAETAEKILLFNF